MDNKLTQMLVKPAMVGGTCFLISKMTDPNTNVSFMGNTYSKALADGVVAAAASWSSDVVGSYIIPHISKDQRLNHLESMLLHPLITGSALVGLEEFLVKGSVARDGFLKTFSKGAVSEITGMYLYSAVEDRKLY